MKKLDYDETCSLCSAQLWTLGGDGRYWPHQCPVLEEHRRQPKKPPPAIALNLRVNLTEADLIVLGPERVAAIFQGLANVSGPAVVTGTQP